MMNIDDARKLFEAKNQAEPRPWRVRALEGSFAFEITTPYLDRHNDYIQIYARRPDGDGWLLTDDAFSVIDLHERGIDLAWWHKEALRGFGVTVDDNELLARATAETLVERADELARAMRMLQGE